MARWTRQGWRLKAFAVAGLLALGVSGTSSPGLAADLVTKPSPHSVDQTLDRLQDVLEERGIRVMGRIDHRDNALTIGRTLRPTQVLVFGNPALGTQLMMLNQRVGLDLPMRVLAWEDDAGQTWLAYHAPATLAERYDGVQPGNDVLHKMTQALDMLTEAATQP